MNKIRKRAPAGVERKRPINLRLMPDERAIFDEIQAKEGVSASRLAREMIVVAMAAWPATNPTGTT